MDLATAGPTAPVTHQEVDREMNHLLRSFWAVRGRSAVGRASRRTMKLIVRQADRRN